MLDAKKTPVSGADDRCLLTSAELTAAYAAGSLSPVEVTEKALERAEAAQESCNAFTLIDHDGALEMARAAEARWQAGAPLSPVDGVPSTIKDIVSIKGWSVRYGSTLTDATPCAVDAPSVARMRAAGLVFLGMTTTPEFGWKAITDCLYSGITRNPWNTDVTPGGSSGGAAVAAAMGAGVFHLGSDGGGSIRIPSAFTGISGIKPTFGRVPAYPASPFGTVAHIGPMCRRPEDAEAMLAVMSGRDLSDWFQGAAEFPALSPKDVTPKGKKIGVWRSPPSGYVEAEVAAQFEKSLADLAEAGAELIEFELPMRDQLLDIFNWHWISGARRRLDMLGDFDAGQIDQGLYQMAEQARDWRVSDYIANVNLRAAYGSEMDRLLAEELDYLVAPGAAIQPFTAGEELPENSGLSRWIEWAGFSYPINLSQQPAMSVPAGLSTGGLPHSLQIIAGRGADSRVLALAKWWQARHPEYFL
ncbi:amidase [Pseudodonghicola xiamenensis]|uniref:Amidase n=1 Tax=Pseudodonghicola xiamenensis TaxID=337702 RepID=A0A8J3H7T5_9RHOB|nr:amidase [Pseudodonghicola xiamenensis]GHG97745.1 amidase [Pseudodonghicola xiamenensis]